MNPVPPTSIVIEPAILYFGTPVALITTLDATGRANITPMSSVWALDDRLVLGLATASQGCANFLARGQAVVNLPSATLHPQVQAVAPTTGRDPVPDYKAAMGYRFEPDKFALGRFTPGPSTLVAPPRIAECPLQMEVELVASHAATALHGEAPGFLLLEARVVKVHAHERIVRPGTQYVDTAAWQPLLYVFRRYFGTGEPLGANFRAE